jgi:hypothetical protein
MLRLDQIIPLNSMASLQIEIPDSLMARLESTGQPVQDVVLKALQQYVETEGFSLTKTQTWQLCGSLEIKDPAPFYVVGKDEQGQPMTNYAEHIDEALY